MAMNDGLKYGLLGLGGYILLQKFGVIQGDLLGSIISVVNPSALPTASTVPTQVSPAEQVQISSLTATADLLKKAQEAAGESSLMTIDQWNYYYTLVRGGAGVDWAAIPNPPKPRDYKLSLTEFLTYYGGGLAGLGNLSNFDLEGHIRSGGARKYERVHWRDL